MTIDDIMYRSILGLIIIFPLSALYFATIPSLIAFGILSTAYMIGYLMEKYL